MENVNGIYHETLLIVENRETHEFNAFFAQWPMVIGKGFEPAEAIIELLALCKIISSKKSLCR